MSTTEAGAYNLDAIRSEYPWQGKFLDVRGHRLHVLDEGKGQPLVMLHGNPTWSFFYRKLVKAFAGAPPPSHGYAGAGVGTSAGDMHSNGSTEARRVPEANAITEASPPSKPASGSSALSSYRVIVPDHIGMGLSDKPDDQHYRYTLEERVKDLENTLEQLEAGNELTLVAHDWGGMIALAFTLRNPNKVKRLVLMNTAGFGLPQGKRLPWQIAMVRYLPTGFLVRGLNAFSRGAVLTCSTRKGRMTPVIQQGYLLPYDSWAHRIAVHRFVQDIPLQPGDPAWSLVKAVSDNLSGVMARPTLLLWGRKDFVFDDGFLNEWRRRVPQAELHTFDDAGHYLLEDAHEEVIPLMQQFLERHPLA